MKTTVSLNNCRFHAFHGLYEDEHKLGNWFTVSIDVAFDLETPADLNQSVDYSSIFEIAKNILSKREDLLEVLADRINKKIILDFPYINKVTTSITKEKLPIASHTGTATVKIEQLNQ